MLADGLGVTTGFGRISKVVAHAFREAGWEVSQIAGFDTAPWCRSEPYTQMGVKPYFPPMDDVAGINLLDLFVDTEQPDVLWINGDPASVANWFNRIQQLGYGHIPTIVYAPVEGRPIAPMLAQAWVHATVPLTYTRYASEALLEEHNLAVDYVYHGVDIDDFAPLDFNRRERVRKELAWSDKFVVIYVARNAERKAQPRLLKAMRVLKDRGVNDVLLYLHCKSFENHMLRGWDLEWLAKGLGVIDRVQFADQVHAVRGESDVSLSKKLSASDLYFHVAEGEGFGLPILEAMACGVPVGVVADEAVQAEVVGDAALFKVAPIHWRTWFNGAQMAELDAEHMADAILLAKHAPSDIIAQQRKKGLDRSKQFSWEPLKQMVLASAEVAISGMVSNDGQPVELYHG